MRHTARAGGMRVRSGRRERHGPFARETSPRGSIPIPPVRGEGPRLLGRPVGQRVLPGLWNPAGRGMPAGIVHIVGPRCGGNPNPTALIPTGLAPRPSLHGFCLTAKKSCWMAVTECSLMTPTMLTCRCRCSDWPAGWGVSTGVRPVRGRRTSSSSAPVVGARSVEQPGGGGSGETS